MIKPNFIHLHVHSDYSMIDGLAKIEALIQKAILLNMPALAITDFTNLFGLVKFYNLAYKFGIKPIVGADFLIQNEITTDQISELTILATNNIGYQNLILLISKAYKRGYGVIGPVIDRNWLAIHNDGLILLSGGSKGDIGTYLMCNQFNKVQQCLIFYKKYFPDRYYLEITRTNRINEEIYLNAAVDLSIQHELPIVATNDVRFIDPNDFEAHEIRVAIHDGTTITDDNKRLRYYTMQQYMRSELEMIDLFADIPEALTNSVEIAKRCNVNLRLGEYFLPKFYSCTTISSQDYLIKCAYDGLNERLVSLFPDILEREKKSSLYYIRLEKELNVINQMAFPDYFLIVMEFVQWAKINSIPVGPGRGSGAGSLVAYALKITDIDPLTFNLLFERFLNPERISLPDFDIDFCMEKRDLVIDHVSNIYGKDAVAQIITFGTLTAKAVIRDVGRVLGYSYGWINRISKLVPSDVGITLEKAIISEPQLQECYNNDIEVRELINMASKLEGVIRNVGKHAGGVVIAPTKITDFAPVYYDTDGNYPVTQFDKTDIEYIGLVKFDFLGLRTLTVISWTLKIINAKRTMTGLKPINLINLPLDDKKTFNTLCRCETTAIFQLESHGIKELIKRLQPDCFEDLIALMALFRPGPLQSGMVDNFINRKHGREVISYPDKQWQHELLRPILASTYGIILYQEQVMQIAQVLASYTLGDADILRRAMGKKKPKEMAEQRIRFQAGSRLIGISDMLSMKIFDLLEKFSGYGFNKSHSTAYALISYQTLWLKTHYPAEFMAAVMSADMDNTEKISSLIDECLSMGIKVLPPNINFSQYYFHVNKDNEIIYGMGAIKGLGKNIVDSIIKIRNQNGLFHKISDLYKFINTKKINQRVLEKLIMSGTCDVLESHRAELINSLSHIIKIANQKNKDDNIGQKDMFGISYNTLVQENSCDIITPLSEQAMLSGELETLGVYLTGHPINQYLQEIKHYSKGKRLKDISLTKPGQITIAIGLVLSLRTWINKRGNRMGLCVLDDNSRKLNIILYTDILIKYCHLLEVNNIIIVYGEINIDPCNDNIKMIAKKIIDIQEARQKYAQELSIILTNKKINQQSLDLLHVSLKTNKFKAIPANFYYLQNNILVPLQTQFNYNVIPSNDLLDKLRTIIGIKEVKLKFN